jgi:hypothetical protein
MEHAKAQDPLLAIVLALVFNLESRTGKDQIRIREIKTTLRQRRNPLGRVKRDCHLVIVATQTWISKGAAMLNEMWNLT